jgi:hypothetical protein
MEVEYKFKVSHHLHIRPTVTFDRIFDSALSLNRTFVFV